ncbi:fibronectin type III domain-containing protein, partial [bacterium]
MVIKRIFLLLVIRVLLLPDLSEGSSFPDYDTNPFCFSVAEGVYGYGDNIFVADLDGDMLLDYTFRSDTKLYVYAHDGSPLWNVAISYPIFEIVNHGTKFGAADIDDDGQVEIVALNNSNQVVIFNGSNGNQEGTINISVGSNQRAGHIAIANIRGEGDRDIVVQTMHALDSNPGYYINRTVIAIRMDTQAEIWRVEQDANTGGGTFSTIYEGYWGQAHGSFLCADVDGDGKDEVIGGNMIDDDGTLVSLGYNTNWIGVNYGDGFVDHLDAVSVGDIRPDLPGIEWVVTEEDWYGGTDWHTTLLSKDGLTWRKETTLFTVQSEREPQNTAVGNFDATRMHSEVWCRSRFGGTVSQHPWVFDYAGNEFAHYATADVLPAGFNTHENGNGEGLEIIWTIDWFGTKKEYIAATARHVLGNVGVFDAITGQAVWTTVDSPVAAGVIYVADVSGDSREEVIVYDVNDGKIKVYWNEEVNLNQPKPNKWDDPLYVHLKQNWNYYSPGGYTYGDYPLISNIAVTDVTPSSATITWDTDVLSDSQIEYGETDDYGFETERDETLTTSHSVELTGLTADTEYHFRIKSRNTYDKLGLSRDITDLTTSELDPPDINSIIIEDSDHLELTWDAVSDATGYNVYRDTTAYFTPDKTGGTNRVATGITDGDPGTDGVQWTDTDDVVGDPETHYFYVVTSIDGTNESDVSDRVGEFDFELISNDTRTDYSMMNLFLNNSMTEAKEIGESISTDGSTCDRVYKWFSSTQRWIITAKYDNGQWENVGDASLYTVEYGVPYRVNIPSGDFVWTIVGEVIDDPQFSLVSNETRTDYNMIILPPAYALDHNITEAKQLGGDISSDGTNCDRVYKWFPSTQRWIITAKYDNGQWENVGDASLYTVQSGVVYRVNIP